MDNRLTKYVLYIVVAALILLLLIVLIGPHL
jgi:hypothetical protein